MLPDRSVVDLDLSNKFSLRFSKIVPCAPISASGTMLGTFPVWAGLVEPLASSNDENILFPNKSLNIRVDCCAIIVGLTVLSPG